MKKSTWNRTIPGSILLLLTIFGLINEGNVPVLMLLGLLGLLLIAAGLFDKSNERV